MIKLKTPEVTYLFKLVNEDLKEHGREMRIGQAIMNNLRFIHYDTYAYLTETNVDPFYNESNVLDSINEVSELNISEVYELLSNSISEEFKYKLKIIGECVK
tara:strand:+ start:7844 stop:8149 length:306 start_codon:yes stop_codon:yes gene_type:complete